MKDKVKHRIDEYLGFNSDELFKTGDPMIFGGAVRDSIADQEIHDIDIMCGPMTYRNLHEFLLTKDYKYQEGLAPKDISAMYHGIRIIAEPKTYVNSIGRVIQLIRPSNFDEKVVVPKQYKQAIDDCIANVDISCCGVSYNGEEVKEHYPNAILHSACKIFSTNANAKMAIKNRLEHRKYKLIDRGWKQFITSQEEAKLIREINLKKVIDD
jgi:hypothetical protein